MKAKKNPDMKEIVLQASILDKDFKNGSTHIDLDFKAENFN
jgi:hypothetical protein